MKDNLYIVESPSKANKIKNLGFDSIRTLGHISEIDVHNYIKNKEIKIIPKKNNFKFIEDKIKNTKGNIIIGTDPDVEGESIAYTISQIAKKYNKTFIRNPLYGLSNRKLSDFVYLKNKTKLDINLIKAATSRSLFDIILSQQFNKTLKKELSRDNLYLGRVQHSVMLLLKEYRSYFIHSISQYRLLSLRKIKNHKVKQFKNTIMKVPNAYNTSNLFLDSINMFQMDLEDVAKVLQSLYVNGAITYPRTEGISLEEATYNKLYLKANEIFDLNKKFFLGNYENAISPLNLDKKFNGNMNKIFNLIMRRSISSMLNNYLTNSVEFQLFFANEKMKKIHLLEDDKNIISKIFMPNYVISSDEEHKPHYIGQGVTDYEIVKLLQSYNIGKPSTIPSIVGKLKDKKYIEKNYDNSYEITSIGFNIIKVLTKKFKFLDLNFYQNINRDFSYIQKGMQNWMFPIIKLKNELKKNNINIDVLDLNDIQNLDEIEYKKLWFDEEIEDYENNNSEIILK